MTPTEAKALALELLNTTRASRGLPAVIMDDVDGMSWFAAICRAIERHEVTEARHAAEMRELEERFSEAVQTFVDQCGWVPACFLPFKKPAPDPLVEALRQAYDAAVAELGEDYVRTISSGRGWPRATSAANTNRRNRHE